MAVVADRAWPPLGEQGLESGARVKLGSRNRQIKWEPAYQDLCKIVEGNFLEAHKVWPEKWQHVLRLYLGSKGRFS